MIHILFIIIFFLSFTIYPQDTTGISEKARQWFEWGEYQHIIENIPGVLSDSIHATDSMTRSQLHVYLGVAYFANGEVGKARDEFIYSLQFNPGAEPDGIYVTDAIMNFFMTTKNEYDKKIEEEKNRQLLILKKEQENKTKQAVIDSLGQKVKKGRKRIYLLSAIITTGFSIGFAGIAGYEYYLGDQEYGNYRSAAERGDFLEYNRCKEKVRVYDTYTILSGAASAVCVMSSTVFYILAHKQNKECRKKEMETVSCNYFGNGIEVIVFF